MPARQTGSDLSIRLYSVNENEYEAHVRRGRIAVKTRFSRDLSASVREDMRLLRWKAIGLHDPGDSLLIAVGDRLSRLLLEPNLVMRRPPKVVRIQFNAGTDDLIHLPWELL